MKKNQKRIIQAAGVALLVAIAYTAFRPRSIDVVGAKVTAHIEQYTVYAVGRGRIQPGSEAFASVKRGGRLDRLSVKIGDTVKKEQILGVIDEKIHRSAVEGALSSYSLAAADWKRARGLYASHVVSTQEVDQARSTFSLRKSELEQERQRFEDGILRAPIAGVLVLLPFQIGDSVPDGARVAVLEDRTQLRINMTIGPRYKGRVPSDATVVLVPKVEAGLNLQLPEKVEAPMHIEVANKGSDYDDSGLDLVLSTDASKLTSIPTGTTVEIHVPIHEYKNVALVPASSIVHRDGKSFVISADNKFKAVWQPVEVAEIDGDQAIVTTPLAEGWRVVVPAPLEALRSAADKHKALKVKSI